MALTIPRSLAANCRRSVKRTAWLERLPDMLSKLELQWSLQLYAPFDGHEVSCSYVVPALRSDGTSAVLKLGMPHMESRDEIHGLRFWCGDPTVRLLEADDEFGAMLLERCSPGTILRELDEPEQDIVMARLLRRLWRMPAPPHAFRPLSSLMDHWREETLQQQTQWPDKGLVREGLRLFDELPRNAPTEALLATDLHAGNVLRAERQPWLVIDPKPFVGDPTYDTTQHLVNCSERVRANPDATIESFADLVEVDHRRVRLWLFARYAAQPRERWKDNAFFGLARVIAP